MTVGTDLSVSISMAGLLISGYALVVVGAPLLTGLTARWSRKTTPSRIDGRVHGRQRRLRAGAGLCDADGRSVLTAFAHGTFFGVGSVVATTLVASDRRASAIAIMFTGLTVANVLGVPFGTWLGQAFGWRSTFGAVALVGLAAFAIIALFVPRDRAAPEALDFRRDLRALMRRPVLLGLLTTVLGYAGVFAVLPYIVPLLTRRRADRRQLAAGWRTSIWCRPCWAA